MNDMEHRYDPATMTFGTSAGGYLSLKIGEEFYPRVIPVRALPFFETERYICVTEPESGEELTMITDLADLPEEQRECVRKELELRYQTPIVKSILRAKNAMGFMNMEVVTDMGKVSFRMRDLSRNLRYLTPDYDRRVLLTDTEGNRYLIPDVALLDRKSRKKIDTYLI